MQLFIIFKFIIKLLKIACGINDRPSHLPSALRQTLLKTRLPDKYKYHFQQFSVGDLSCFIDIQKNLRRHCTYKYQVLVPVLYYYLYSVLILVARSRLFCFDEEGRTVSIFIHVLVQVVYSTVV